ncbi:MAG: hypothetical protein AAGC97_12965 [Planctomycetota bacterium]
MDVTTEPVIAVIGDPIAGNPTQFAMETALDRAGVDARVLSLSLPPHRIATALDGMSAMSFRGVWIDASCQVPVAEYLAATGVVNQDVQASPNSLDGLVAHEDATDSPAVRETGPWHPIRLRDPIWTKLVASRMLDCGYSLRSILIIGGDEARQFEIRRFLVNAEHQLGRVQAEQIRCVAKWIPAIDLSDVNLVIWADQDRPSARPAADAFPHRADLGLLAVDLGYPLDGSVATIDGIDFVSRLDVHAGVMAATIRRWLGCDVAVDVIRDAIEEYLDL